MKKPLLLAASVASLILSSCSYKTTFLVQEPRTGLPMYARYRHVEKDSAPSDRDVAAMTRKMTGGLTPEQLGREYFPGQGPDGNATVSVAPYTGSAPAKPGWSKVCYVAQVTVSAKASRAEFQQALNKINKDFYNRTLETQSVVKFEDLSLVVDGKPAPSTFSIQESVEIPVKR
ncbi:MAG: hypothetical protein EOP88_20455 [Verrucomicrobiaceae bacterium]|nr:MAG: hypothetical protein EOP88_20455 [Verrucomicrobiaceae bacterium]